MSKRVKWGLIIVGAIVLFYGLLYATQSAVADPLDPVDQNTYDLPVGQSITVPDPNGTGMTVTIKHVADDPVSLIAKSRYCRTAKWVAWQNGVGGVRFATWHFNQRFCYGVIHGHVRVYSVERPHVSCDTSAVAAGVGWHCDGISDSYGFYKDWHHDWHGAHVSARKYKMEACAPEPLGCVPWHSYHEPMKLVVHGNGTDRFALRF